MNEPRQPEDSREPQRPENGRPESVSDVWRELDDTLADGPAPADLPEESKPWIAEQRLMHGLLRALHTADASAREGRISTLLERIDQGAGQEPRRQWLRVAAAALVLACAGVFFVLPASLPTAQAAVERAVKELARDVNRRFGIEILGAGDSGAQFLLVTAPGNRFRIDGKFAFGPMMISGRCGCDGQELWLNSANGVFKRHFPFAERERQLAGLDQTLGLGYLDVHNLVKSLTAEYDVSVVGREQDAKGQSRLRLDARRRGASGGGPRSMRLQCDEETGMVTRIDIDSGRGSLRFEYLGEEPARLVDYRRPW